MSEEILEQIKNNKKELKGIKIKMIVFKYLEVTTLISGGLYLLENTIKNSVYGGFLKSLIVTTISTIPYALMTYGAHYFHKKNKIKKAKLEKINEELRDSDNYSKSKKKEKEKENEEVKVEEEVKAEEVVKENEEVKAEEVVNKNKEETKIERPTISEQKKSLEELKAQIMNLEIEQSYEEEKKYVKAK